MTGRGEVGQGSAAATERGENSAALESPKPPRVASRRVVGDNSGLVLEMMEASTTEGVTERSIPLSPSPHMVEEVEAAKVSSPAPSALLHGVRPNRARTKAAKHDNDWICADCGFRNWPKRVRCRGCEQSRPDARPFVEWTFAPGRCRYGSGCKFRHEGPGAADVRTSALEQRQTREERAYAERILAAMPEFQFEPDGTEAAESSAPRCGTVCPQFLEGRCGMGAACFFRHPSVALSGPGSEPLGGGEQGARLEACGACGSAKPRGSLRPITTLQGTPTGVPVCHACYSRVQRTQHDRDLIPMLTDVNRYLVQRAGCGYRNAQVGHLMGVVLQELCWQLAPPEVPSPVLPRSAVGVPVDQVNRALRVLREGRELIEDSIRRLHQSYPWTRSE